LEELASVIVILSVLASIAVPRFAKVVGNRQLAAAADRVAVDLAHARHRAKISSTTQRLVFNPDTDSYTLIGVPDPDHAGADYIVSLSGEPYRAQIVSVDLDGGAEIGFDMYGDPVDSSGNPSSGGSIDLRVGDRIRSVQVDGTTGYATVMGTPGDGTPVGPDPGQEPPLMKD